MTDKQYKRPYQLTLLVFDHEPRGIKQTPPDWNLFPLYLNGEHSIFIQAPWTHPVPLDEVVEYII